MSNNQKSILIVEDDQNICRALSIRLRAAGYTVHSANNAIDAPKVAKEVLPDLLLLDIALPGGDGFEVAKTIDGMSLNKDIKRIYITASKKPGLWKKAVDTKANGFIEKPFESKELLDQIQSAFMYSQPLQTNTK